MGAKKRLWLVVSFSSYLILLGACTLPSDVPTASATPATTATLLSPPSVLPSAVATLLPPTSAPTPTVVENIIIDFVVSACEAEWSNNAYHLPCPGHLEETKQGYVEYTDHTVAEGMTSIEAPMLVALPGQGNGSGIGLFGRYPVQLIYPGDVFQATIACQGDSPCNTEFALEYFDASGVYHDTDWSWQHQVGDGLEKISVDLSSLAGQSVSLMLVMRDQKGTSGNWLVWIQPRVTRDPEALPVPTILAPSPTSDAGAETPGVISGKVEMGSAPPYLNDPMTNESTPVVVAFFNQDDGSYWYIQTLLTGHPFYQMTVPPGNYYVVAYARGVGDVPYVSGGYTGVNPSCGQALQVVEVTPNAQVKNISIADWNWKCGGSAYHPEKPDAVPVP
ncbi:MAG: hypothetical protein HN855_13755 [Anaerolineae bacterium]|jgi:hypothetical protein|nr:hypothetical protein [Anaerolineae bacterium]MBT7070591.1 hypothetical protein [Anaerolineae bacterium]MBT7326221.1 hypothetical protein [Anaerolineae bacterium]